MDNNVAVLAAAGSGKTTEIIQSALAVTDGRVLILTFTNENQRHIINRIEKAAGVVPSHVSVMGWFSFLISQCAKPYQRAITGQPFFIRGLNFQGQRNRFVRKTDRNTSQINPRYFLDRNAEMYRDGAADFAVILNEKTDGAVIGRLEKAFTHIFVDEVQDLAGYDLDVLDLLLASDLEIFLVGDPRQRTYTTNLSPRNRGYRGAGMIDWFQERAEICEFRHQNFSHRCNQPICDFADAIFPNFQPTQSRNLEQTGHDGIFQITREEVQEYFDERAPVTVLRWDKNSDTEGLPAMNIGLSKGDTFDRVMIFPTRPMVRYVLDGDVARLSSREKLYVAVTRARHSVAFVMPDP